MFRTLQVNERPRVGWASYKRDPKGEGLHILSAKEREKKKERERGERKREKKGRGNAHKLL